MMGVTDLEYFIIFHVLMSLSSVKKSAFDNEAIMYAASIFLFCHDENRKYTERAGE